MYKFLINSPISTKKRLKNQIQSIKGFIFRNEIIGINLTNLIMNDKKCLECGEKVVGRIDKKFCSDYCRNSYNNKVNKESKNLIRNINNRLRKNYKILEELNKSGKTKIPRRKLFDRGFDFRLFTSTYTTKVGSLYFYVYDQGYLELENETYLLVKQD